VLSPSASAAKSTRRALDVTELRNARLRLESAFPKHSFEQNRLMRDVVNSVTPHSSHMRSNLRRSVFFVLSMPSLRSSSFGVDRLHGWQQWTRAESLPNQTGPWQIAQGRFFLYSSSERGRDRLHS
jgi:hypothetical protein